MSIFSDDNPQVIKSGRPGGGKTQEVRERVRSKAPRHVYLVEGDWEKQRLFQLASATTLDVRYIREDLAPHVAVKSIEDAASAIFNYVHETDGGHKSDFTQRRLIEILSEHFGVKE